MKKKKRIKRRFYQYLPKHLIRGLICYLIAVYLLLQGLYWYQFYRAQKTFNGVLSTDGVRDFYTMLKQASLEEQEADYRYKIDNMKNSVRLNVRYIDQRSTGYCAVIDRETGEIVMDTETPMQYLIICRSEEDFINPTYPLDRVSVYCCPKEYLQEAYDEQQEWQRELQKNEDYRSRGSSGTFGVSLKDAYIKGDRFFPGKLVLELELRLRDGRGEHYEIRKQKEYDFTPADVSGYQHIFAEDYVQCYLDDINRGLQEYPELQVAGGCKDEALAMLLDYDGFGAINDRNTGIRPKNPLLAFLDKKMTFFHVERVEEVGQDAKKYNLVLYWELSVGSPFETRDVFYMLCWIAAFFGLGTLLFAAVDYFLHRFRFMTEEYRKTLADSMAHDLKSPLMAISGYAENLKENVHEEKREYYAEEILNSVTYMDHLVRRNLELLNYERFQKSLQRTKVDLKTLCEKILKRYETDTEKKHLEIILAGEMIASADEYLIERVFDNLISNAIKYASENSRVELFFSKYEFRIQNQTELTYTGSLSKLWDPMVRGEDSRTGKGSGLGLSIASNILDRHKWKYKLFYRKEEKIFCCRIRIPVGLMF